MVADLATDNMANAERAITSGQRFLGSANWPEPVAQATIGEDFFPRNAEAFLSGRLC